MHDWTARGLDSVVELPFALATGFLHFCLVADGDSLPSRVLGVPAA